MTVLQKFDIHPSSAFTEEEAIVFINTSNVLVQQNTLHNAQGAGDFNVSGVQICGDPDQITNVHIENNTIYSINNYGRTAASRDTLLFEDFDAYTDGYDFDGTALCGFFDQLNFGVACGTTYHYAEVENYKSHSAPNSAEIYYNCPNDDWLVTPPIDASGYSNLELNFWYLWDDSWDIDFSVYVEISTNPNVWNFIKSYSLPGQSPETWYEDTLSLAAYDGETIRIAWRYTSDDEWAAYFDDILVTGDPGGGPGPSAGRCGAIGVLEQGLLGDISVMNNGIEDIHSAGHAYGVEWEPINPAPLTFQPATDWIQYHDDYTDNALGLTAGGVMTTAIELTDAELAGFRGDDICEVKASMGSDEYGPYAGIPYEVWIQDSKPTDPTTANIVGTGTSTSTVWTTVDVNDYTIPATGSIFLGINYDQPASTFPGGMDNSNSIQRGGLLWYAAGGWTDLNAIGYSYVWGISAGVCVGGGGGGAGVGITINCNYFREVNDNSTYNVWANPTAYPLPGVMVMVQEPDMIGPANASAVTMKCNFFDPDCMEPVYAVGNKDTNFDLDATLNYWGTPNGPNGGMQDPITGDIADGFGAHIAPFESVMFAPWLGVHADITLPMGGSITVEEGDVVHFDGSESFAYCFDGCENCCDPMKQPLQYLWEFGDGRLSTNAVAHHQYTQEGTYQVSLMVDATGFPYFNAYMYDWDYCEVIVVPQGTPLTANADGENLGGYETTIDLPVTLYGTAIGGKEPYYYSWDFGDGTSSQTSNPKANIITHSYKQPGTYTVTLTVRDSNGDSSTDTSTVLVYDIEELVVNIDGSKQVAQGDAVTFTSTVSGGQAPYSYEWDFGDGVISNKASPTHIYETIGTYVVTLTVTDVKDNQVTKTLSITVSSTDISEVEISNVKAGLLISATIDSDSEVPWAIDVEGMVFLGGHGQGTAFGSTQIRLPFTLGLGSVDITISAGNAQKVYTAKMVGPFLFNLQEA
jgi:PKD repeat protein